MPGGQREALGGDSVAERCFDRALAVAHTRALPIDCIVDLLPVSHVPERVEEYRRAMTRGDRFPPISVVRIAGRFVIADGHKRFSAYASLPVTSIVVEVWSIRRWLRDPGRQLRGKTRQQCTLAWQSIYDRGARARATRLFWDTISHWRRIARSLALRARNPQRR